MAQINVCIVVLGFTNTRLGPCMTLCTIHFDPLCGTDNITYINQCFLKNAQCKTPNISQSYKGKCNPQPGKYINNFVQSLRETFRHLLSTFGWNALVFICNFKGYCKISIWEWWFKNSRTKQNRVESIYILVEISHFVHMPWEEYE